jgi:hypothetical protein
MKTNLNTAAPITEKLILVRFKMHQWSGRKFDKPASDRFVQLLDADQEDEAEGGPKDSSDAAPKDSSNVGRFNKILVERKSLLTVFQARTELLNRHKHLTAPWTDDGVRVLTAELFFQYTQQMREAGAAYVAAGKHYAHEVYPGEIEKAKERLGPLFKPSDYPTTEELEYQHRAPSIHFEPLPNPQDVRVWGVGEIAAREIEADVRNSVQAGIDAAHAHVATTLIERAQEFVAKVRRYDSGETKQLRASAVENLREMVEVVLKGLNVKRDPALTDLARQLEIALRTVAVDELRDETTLRKNKTAEIDRIAGKFAGVFASPVRAAGGAV